jgi:hypothetical protein
MMSKLFFYYYRFYNFVLRDDTPVYTAVFTMSASISIIFVTILNITLVVFEKNHLNTWQMFSTLLPVLGYNAYQFLYKGKAEMIIKSYTFWKSEFFISMAFLVFSIICMVLGPVLTRYIIELKL